MNEFYTESVYEGIFSTWTIQDSDVYYNFFREQFADLATLLYTDTESQLLIHEYFKPSQIISSNLFKHRWFNTLNCCQSIRCDGITKNKSVSRQMEDEQAGK